MSRNWWGLGPCHESVVLGALLSGGVMRFDAGRSRVARNALILVRQLHCDVTCSRFEQKE